MTAWNDEVKTYTGKVLRQTSSKPEINRVNKLESDKDFIGVCSYHGDCLEVIKTNNM